MKLATRLGLTACVALGAMVPASANHSWNNYHWARTTEGALSVRVNVAVDAKWAPYISTAIAEWDAPVNDPYDTRSEPDVLTLTSGNVTVDRRKCNPIRGQILVCNYAYGKRGWLGIASVWLDGSGHIIQGTTKLNDSYYGTGSSYDNYGFRAMVACQEIGHDFGLAHQNENFTNANVGSCMDYTNNPMGGGTNGSKTNDKPNYHDYEQLALMYNHGDGTTTATTTGASTNFGERTVGRPAPQESRGSGDSPAEWGSPIHRDSKGRPDQFMRRFPDGTTMITHVFWTLEANGTGRLEDDGHTN